MYTGEKFLVSSEVKSHDAADADADNQPGLHDRESRVINNYGDNLNLAMASERQRRSTDLKYILHWNEAYGSKEDTESMIQNDLIFSILALAFFLKYSFLLLNWHSKSTLHEKEKEHQLIFFPFQVRIQDFPRRL